MHFHWSSTDDCDDWHSMKVFRSPRRHPHNPQCMSSTQISSASPIIFARLDDDFFASCSLFWGFFGSHFFGTTYPLGLSALLPISCFYSFQHSHAHNLPTSTPVSSRRKRITMFASGLARDRREMLRHCHHKQDNSRHPTPPPCHPPDHQHDANETTKKPEQLEYTLSETSPSFLSSLWNRKH